MPRIFDDPIIVVSGGGGGGCEADLAGTIANSQYAPAFTALEFAADPADSRWQPAFTDLEVAANPADSRWADAFTELEYAANPADSQWAPAWTTLDYAGDVAASQYTPAFTALEFAADPANSRWSPAWTDLELAADMKNSQWKIGQYTVDVTDMEARADCWYTNVAGCVGGGNNNDAPLTADSAVATRKDLWARFPVTDFPTGTSVTALAWFLTLEDASGGLAKTLTVVNCDEAQEGWVETTPSCNAPLTAENGAGATIAANTADESEFDLVGATTAAAQNNYKDRLANRMGVSSYTLGLAGTQVSSGAQDFHDRTNAMASKRPRINFTFTKTV